MAVRKSTRKAGLSDSRIKREYRALKVQKAQLADATIDAIEKRLAASSGDSQYRRIALAALARSGKDLIAWAENGNRDSGEAMADALVGVESVAKFMRALTELLECSANRLLLALCSRADAVELIGLARAARATTAETSNV